MVKISRKKIQNVNLRQTIRKNIGKKVNLQKNIHQALAYSNFDIKKYRDNDIITANNLQNINQINQEIEENSSVNENIEENSSVNEYDEENSSVNEYDEENSSVNEYDEENSSVNEYDQENSSINDEYDSDDENLSFIFNNQYDGLKKL